jgi:uncharacterized protein YkwD
MFASQLDVWIPSGEREYRSAMSSRTGEDVFEVRQWRRRAARALVLLAACGAVVAGGERAATTLGGGTALAAGAHEPEASPWTRYLAPPGTCADDASPEAEPRRQAAAMRCLLAWARSERGLPPLAWDARLQLSAEAKAAAVVRCAEFSHTPCDRPVAETFASSGWVHDAGENLAWGAGEGRAARVLVERWLRSPGHRANLLGDGWRAQGLALVRVERFLGTGPATVWVHHLGA